MSFGGVAVLVVLFVMARSRLVLSDFRGVEVLEALEPKENVLPEARMEKEKGDSGMGGTGMASWGEWSVDEGRVDEELYLADEALELS